MAVIIVIILMLAHFDGALFTVNGEKIRSSQLVIELVFPILIQLFPFQKLFMQINGRLFFLEPFGLHKAGTRILLNLVHLYRRKNGH